MTVVGGSVRAGVEIGEVSGGEFCRLPQPGELFASRADRFEHLAHDHPMADYLRFLAALTRAQQAAVAAPSGFASPTAAHLERCREHAMPPFAFAGVQLASGDGVIGKPSGDVVRPAIDVPPAIASLPPEAPPVVVPPVLAAVPATPIGPVAPPPG